MIKTLHTYLTRELVKISLLALAAFTLIMTIFAVIEPMRRYLLDPRDAVSLIAYTLPMMLSFTLPVAVLFAATIVYGRFGQDNEMLACRASGISTMSVLKPALVLGGTVAVISLVLSSFVTPKMAMLAEIAVKANVRGIAYGRLRRKTFVEWGAMTIHADSVNEEENSLTGVVVVHSEDMNNLRLVVAPKTLVDFKKENNDTWVTIYPFQASLVVGNEIVNLPPKPLEPRKLPSRIKEDPSWYDWKKLLDTLENPTKNSQIRKFLESIQQQLCHDMLAKSIAMTIQAGRTYSELRADGDVYHIRAGAAEVGSEGVVKLKAAHRGDDWLPVEVTVLRKGKAYQLIVADAGQVQASLSELTGKSFVTVKLGPNVTVHNLTRQHSLRQQRRQWDGRQLPIPGRFIERSKRIRLQDIISRADELTQDKKILKRIGRAKDRAIHKLLNQIKAEMHMRAAFGVGCFLMVAMGAAMGLILRGGQVIVAFAITAVPASLVIVMMFVGKQIAVSRGTPAIVGLAVIWGGVIALMIANAGIYYLLSRK